MTYKVLDASALIAYLEKETGYEVLEDLFSKAVEAEKKLLMSTVNWGEVYYILARDHGLKNGEGVIGIIQTFPIDLVPADINLARQAALYKYSKKLPYADCFAAALTKLHKGELITCDKEFRLVDEDIKILWLN